MKKLLVPVDFSEASENAAHYACAMACHIGAKVELLHVCKTPIDVEVISSTCAAGEDEFSDLSNSKLVKLCQLTAQKMSESNKKNGFEPAIVHKTLKGEVMPAISKHFVAEKMNLIVMGLTKVRALNKAIFGSTVNSAISGGKLPLLLIPERIRFKKIEKMAFATDLNLGDISLLCLAGELARKFNADLLIMHSSLPQEDETSYQKRLKEFLEQVSGKVGYPKVYYRRVISKSIDEGLHHLLTDAKPDMLMMVHHEHGFWGNMLIGSYTKRMARHINLPLLVFPSGHKSLI